MKTFLALFFALATVAFGALSSTIVWEVRSAGADTNSGGFKTGATGTDWTQQNGAQYALTSIATAGAGGTFLTTSAASDMVGNVAHVVSGTNFTAGFYEIISVSAGVSVTCDANVCTGVGASGVINIGGALASIGKIGSASANQGAVAGNYIYVKGSFTPSSTDTVACSGSSTSPIVIRGYGTTRGDGYLGRTNGNGPLITTNMPTIAYSGTVRLNATGTWILIDCLNVSSHASNPTISIAGNSCVRACLAANDSTNASAAGINMSAGPAMVFNCDATMTGATGGSGAIIGTASGDNVVGCRATTASASADDIKFNTGAAARVTAAYNTCWLGAQGIEILDNSSSLTAISNTISAGLSGIKIVTGSTVLHFLFNNCITDGGGYAIDMVSAANAGVFSNNRSRDNFSGDINLATNWAAATNFSEVTSGTGTSDYVNYAGQDFRLIKASPATAAGVPLYLDIGSLQRQESGGGGSFTFAQ